MNKKFWKLNGFPSRLLASGVAVTMATAMFAQSAVITGNVKDETGEPVVGASVKVKGTTTGAVTDINGNFSVKADKGATLQISYVGMAPTQAVVRGNAPIRVVMKEDGELDEVMVVGYGVQKKSVVTAAIAKVSSEDMENKSPMRMDDALKGLAAGVNVTSASGQPGEAPRVRIRGVGTINDSDPLYIVDGMPMDGGLDIVNPSDIESIEVLKDAASAAIYGARAANGVILVTTKRGKQGKTNVSYNFAYGWQSAARHRDVTSATDYAILQNEKYVNGGMAPLYADPYNLSDSNGNLISGFGTDWQNEVFNDNAPVAKHELSISGANDKVNYYLSLGYLDWEGIVGGNFGQSNYDRLTLRSNTIYHLLDATKERNFLNKADLTVNVSYLRTHGTGISTNTEFGSVLGSALYMAPTIAPVATGAVGDAMNKYYTGLGYELPADANGNPYSVPMYFGTFQEMNNPLAMMTLNPNQNWSHKIMPAFALDLQIWDNLKFRSSWSADQSFWGNEGATKTHFYLSNNNKGEHTEASKSASKSTRWQIENVLSYDKTFDKHTVGVTLGQSAMKTKGDNLGGSRWNLVNPDKPSIDYATGNVEDGVAQFGVYGGTWAEYRMSSLFGRLSYNFDERYMFQATVRRDGSSRFGSNNKYGTFPSFSAGWNVTNEPFMQDKADWLKMLKVRASWGVNGSDRLGNFRYTTLTQTGNNVLIGKDPIKQNGSKANGLANPDLKWEESVQTDFGVDMGLFENALTFTVDYFIKDTEGMLMVMPIPSYVGESKPWGNVGKMRNSGWEFEVGYKWRIGDAKFAAKANASYLHNELVKLGNDTGFENYDSAQGIGTITRGENGQPFPFFYGYKTAGVFQNWDEVNAYVNANGEKLMPEARPGDVRFVDVNGDGTITTDDRTNIGNGTPDWTFGLNLNAEWKGFDFNLFFQGVSGADVFDATYRTDVYSGNYPTWMLNRWTGEGTSNKYPMLRLGDDKNWQVSDLYVCDGSYMRLKNLSIGYTLPRALTQKVSVDRLRLYVQGSNLITWTKYWGFDPEISSGGTSLGVDRGVYPQARTWTIGAQISF